MTDTLKALAAAASAGLSTAAIFFNGEAWMATAQLDGHFLQVAGPIIDPELALLAALTLALDNRGNPEAQPWGGKTPLLTDDGY